MARAGLNGVRLTMNRAQKKLAGMWCIVITLLLTAISNHRWMLDNWKWLKWPLLWAIFVIAIRGDKDLTGWGHGKSLNDFLQAHPVLKAWVALYTFCILCFLGYGLTHGIAFQESPGFWLLVVFVPLFFPLLVISEWERYKRLGAKSNY